MKGLIIDNFAGGGGASLGIEMALGRSPDVAVNHDRDAVAMHTRNHSNTRHLCEDVWAVDPVEVCAGQPVALGWFSPDCKHFSKAKGGKPIEKKIRGLAWVVVKWAKAVRPNVIILENVEEFEDWGPLVDDRPDRERLGLTFRRWVGQLKKVGYRIEWKTIRACDYGAPTIRKRLFLIARCDGRPIVWPQPTHGPGRARLHRVAAECIQWELACPSIFGRKKTLADKTLARIARGIQRFVLDAAEPFIIPVTHQGDLRSHGVSEPLRTVTGAHRGEMSLVSPTLIQTGYGERLGQAPRSLDLFVPLGTVMGGGAKHALVAAFLAKHYGGVVGVPMTGPMGTITTQDHHSLVAVPTAGAYLAEVRAFLTRYNGTGGPESLKAPLGTITTRDRFGLVRLGVEDYAIADIGMRMLQPRELFRAQGFPDTYEIEHRPDGSAFTKTTQIRLCGNSVSPVVGCALVSANVEREEAEVA